MPTGNEAWNKKLHDAARPRAEKVLRLRKAGKKWREIGAALGISGTRAYMLAKAHTK